MTDLTRATRAVARAWLAYDTHPGETDFHVRKAEVRQTMPELAMALDQLVYGLANLIEDPEEPEAYDRFGRKFRPRPGDEVFDKWGRRLTPAPGSWRRYR